jgi:hypothetical protein
METTMGKDDGPGFTFSFADAIVVEPCGIEVDEVYCPNAVVRLEAEVSSLVT